ncbi:MAG: Ig-like domain-containing protein [candidate division KSB1 bacterium]|nr:Ig-like domain-containing protein [candidate division KSB1 bacterium]
MNTREWLSQILQTTTGRIFILPEPISHIPDEGDYCFISSETLPYQEQSFQLSLRDIKPSRGVAFVDIDNDGDFDLFIGNSDGGCRLYENLGNSMFSDITTTAGIDNLNRLTTGIIAFDCDMDNDMDLYVINSRVQNELYINNGQGRFIREDRGTDDVNEPDIPSLTGSVCDYDMDGDPDIYITKRFAPNVLFINDGSGHFSEGAQQAGIAVHDKSNGAVWGDLNNDGFPDLLVTVSENQDEPYLYVFENNQNGTFTDRTAQLGIPMDGYSVLTGDFDNDGDVDIITSQEEENGHLYRNEGNWSFTQTANTGAEVLGGDPRGGTVFDYDNDGDLDFLLTRSDMLNVFRQNNLQSENHYISFDVYGPHNNRGGMGTKIWCFPAGELENRQALLGYREVTSSQGHISQPALVQHFGLGAVREVDVLARFTDGTFLIRRGLAADQHITLKPALSAGVSGSPNQLSIYSGDAQSVPAGETAPQALAVQVLDAKNRPVEGVSVNFEVTEGDAELFTPQIDQDNLSIEPERGQLENEMQWFYDETASGHGIVGVPFYWNQSGSAVRQFELASSKRLYAWIRVEQQYTNANLSVQLDGNPPVAINIPNQSGWQWIQMPGGFLPDILNSGSHSVRFNLSGPGVRVDKLFLTPDPAYTPTGLEETGSASNLTDRQGITRRFIQMGQNIGPVQVAASLFYNGTHVTGSPAIFNLQSTAGPAVRMQKTAGDDQAGDPGIPLDAPFQVTCYDALNNPVSGHPITFTLLSGDGSLSTSSTVLTDVNGHAETTLTPGKGSSTQRVRAESPGLNGSPLTFTAYIRGVAENLFFLSGDKQLGTVKTVLAEPIRVKVTTEDGSPAFKYGVQFHCPVQGARIASDPQFSQTDSIMTLFTDTLGIVTAYWQLGETSGAQPLTIKAPGLTGSPHAISANARASFPAYILSIGGNQQSAVIQETLGSPLKVRVLDDYGNGIVNHPVTFQALSNRGTFNGFADKTVSTDSSGTAAAFFTTGTIAGENVQIATVTAEYNGAAIPGSPVPFVANMSPGEPVSAEKIFGDQQSGTVTMPLERPFTVQVRDSYNNPVPGFDVTFRVQGPGHINGGSTLDVTTDQTGKATATLTLSQQTGLHTVQAVCSGLSPDVLLFQAFAEATSPESLLYISGNDQTGSTHADLPQALTVQVVDTFANPVSGYPVEFTVTSAQGLLNGERSATVTTEASGNAAVRFTLGDEMGDSLYTIQARAFYQNTPLINSPVSFVASARIGRPESLITLTPAELTGGANQTLPEPIRVKIVDSNNYPISNFPVIFEIIAGSGILQPDAMTMVTKNTNSQGIASVQWKLGKLGEDQELMVSARDGSRELSHSPVTFQAATQETHASSLAYESGNLQQGLTHTQLNSALIVKVVNEYGSPVSGHSVIYTRIQGDGYFLEPSSDLAIVESDESGLASVEFVTGQTAGDSAYVIKAESFNQQGQKLDGSPIYFYISAEQSENVPHHIKYMSGSNQQDTVGTDLENPLVVQVLNQNEQPLTDIPVYYTITQGHAYFTNDSTQYTNPDGMTGARLHLGTQSGTIKVLASVAQVNTAVLFTLTALPAQPETAKIVNGASQTGIAGHRLNQPLVVQLTDRYENGVNLNPVIFTPYHSGGRIFPADTVLTDTSGAASVEWQLADTTGNQAVTAAIPSLPDTQLTFQATALANQRPRFQIADSFTINENELLAFFITVTDPEDDQIVVSASPLPEGASFNPDSLQFTWTPSSQQSGRYSIQFTATDQVGAKSKTTVRIQVLSSNNPPVISLEYSVPLVHNLGTLTRPGYMDFAVYATDPDNDQLHYVWQVNGTVMASTLTFRLQSALAPEGPVEVKALVFDQQDTVSAVWNLNIVTAVKLVSFKGAYVPFKGYKLEWETGAEFDNRGFYIQRAETQKGPFETVSELVAPNPHGIYTFTDHTGKASRFYFYRLQDISRSGNVHNHDIIKVSPPLPERYVLYQNHPNPFNPATEIRFETPQEGKLILAVYNTLGQRVTTLVNKRINPGYHQVSWSGENENGEQVASGIYYIVLSSPGVHKTRKAVLLR